MERWEWANPKTFLKKPSEKPNGVIMGPPSPQTSEPEMEKRNGHLMGDGDGENDGENMGQTWSRHRSKTFIRYFLYLHSVIVLATICSI